ncbi:sulfotransferase [Rhodopirellula maiorica SM1]|uniref:Sulfotransferase n=2 Tax=Novipirellula TaxID=2795426 RepID=M5RT71_9BACT|nr:sulfotransferase [Rhodopirellula maiorica SM1]
MSGLKEPAYFAEEVNLGRGLTWYLDLFKEAGDAQVVGESSTHYTKLPTYQGVPERIQNFAPDAKFIFLMRDPLARSISQYWHHYQGRRSGEVEKREMLEAFQEDQRYLAYSNYALQLQPYLDRFGSASVKVFTLEEFRLLPQFWLKQLYEWLGVDSEFVADSIGAKVHETPALVTRRVRWLYALKKSPLWETVRVGVPAPIRGLGERLSERAPVERKTVPIDDAIRFASPILQQHTQDLSDLLGRDFPEWKMLWDQA